jgi:hypothetical protein
MNERRAWSLERPKQLRERHSLVGIGLTALGLAIYIGAARTLANNMPRKQIRALPEIARLAQQVGSLHAASDASTWIVPRRSDLSETVFYF